MNIEEREVNLLRFETGQTKMLITTDLLSSGVEFNDTQIVVNYELAMNNNNPIFTSYLNRSGRVGRFGQNGISISLDAASTFSKFKEEWNISINEISLC